MNPMVKSAFITTALLFSIVLLSSCSKKALSHQKDHRPMNPLCRAEPILTILLPTNIQKLALQEKSP